MSELSIEGDYIDTVCPECGARMIRATITGLFDTGAGGWQVDYCGECE